MNRHLTFLGIVLSLCSFQTSCTALHSRPQAEVVFVLYDTGETRALEPVIARLQEKKISTLVLGVGTSRELIGNRSDFLDVNAVCGVRAKIDRTHWRRESALPALDVKRLEACFDASLVVTGMASRFQSQLAEALYSKKDSKVWGYFDGFSRESVNATSTEFIESLDQVLVPARSVEAEFKIRASQKVVKTVGQPSLEKWKAIMETLDKAKLRKSLNLTDATPVILYAGGYGDGYEEAFRLFVRSVKGLSNYHVLVSLHPRVDGEFERRAIKEEKGNSIEIIPKEISTAEALAISEVLVSHRSTTGVQAVFAGKPAIYLDGEKDKYSDLAIENGWAQQVFSEPQFKRALARAVGIKRRDIYRLAGIPKDSEKIIVDLVMRELNKNQ